MPGGGFPIENVSDLHNAIQAIGRAKNPDAAKAHIKARAKALGQEDLIPDTWKRAPAADDIDLTAIDLGKSEELDMTLDELKKMIGDQITTSVPDLIAGTLTKIMPDIVGKAVGEAVTKALPPEFLANQKKPKDDSKSDGKPEPDEDDAKKALAIAALPASVRKVFDDAEKNAATVQKFMAERELENFSKRAVGMGLKKEDGILMQKAYSGDAAAQKAFEERLAGMAKAAAGMEKAAIVFTEFGDNRGGSEGNGGASAYDQMMGLAKELRKKETNLTEAQAYAKVSTDPANRELAKQERDERMAKIHHFQ
jgi:hypothetical protein